MIQSDLRHDFPRAIALSTFSPWFKGRTWHFLFMTLITLSLFTVLSVLSGCSGAGGSGGSPTTPADTPDDDDDGYTGSAKVAGTIKLSYLSSSDSAEVEDGTPVGRRKGSKAVDTVNEAVRLYVVGENGELEDTGISCSMDEDENGDRSYECDGVKDGVNYIIRYMKLSGTGKALELKANAFVPQGEDSPEGEVDVSPQSSVVVQALVDAVLSATAGTGISDDLVNAIIESVKNAIEALVASGVIQIPSMVLDVDLGTTLADLIGNGPENDGLGNAAGMILADSSIGAQLGFMAAEFQADLFDLTTVDTAEEKEVLIRKVFNDFLTDDKGGSDDMPQFFYNFFTWLYVNNDTVTMGELLTTLLGSMEYGPAAINIGNVTVGNVLTMFNSQMSTLHALLAKDPTTLTDNEKSFLAQYPGVIRGLFPTGFGTATASTSLVTPQAIAMVIFVEKIFMPATVIPAELDGSADDGGTVSYSEEDYFRWDDMAFFDFLGLPVYVASHPAEFTGVSINGLYLHPNMVWIDGVGSKEALMLDTNVMNLAAFASSSDPSITDASGATVTLTYPKASGGTGTISLVYMTHDGGSEGSWGLNPWSEAYMADPVNVVINPARVVSDFTSGTYTITIVLDGKTTTKSFEKTVITGMGDAYVKMISPAGMPIWPGDDATSAEIDAYSVALKAFDANGGRTNYSANVMDDGSAPGLGDTASKAKITVSWQPPAVTLPEGVKMVYSIDIGQSNCTDTMNCTWTPIWNSWNTNKRIYTTAFTIPYLFPVQSAEAALSNPYHINIGVYFVNQATGEQLGTGGNAHSEFSVGEPIDLNATFTIRGLNAITIKDDAGVNPAHLRAAVVKETQVGDTFTRTIVKIADISGSTAYSLTFKIGNFLSVSNVNTWYNMVLIQDASDTLEPGDYLNFATMTYWPDYSAGNMWFDTWGGMLKVGKNICTSDGTCVNTMDIITGGEVIDGPAFFIGSGGYVAPDPSTLTPVPLDQLDDTFSIVGNINSMGMTQAKVVLIEEGMDSASGFMVQTVKRVATLTASQYTLSPVVGDFYDAAGLPTGKSYQILLVDDEISVVTEGYVLSGSLPLYWPDGSTMNFGFDTWKGGSLYIYKDIFDSVTGTWAYTSVAVPGDTITVYGPNLATSY